MRSVYSCLVQYKKKYQAESGRGMDNGAESNASFIRPASTTEFLAWIRQSEKRNKKIASTERKYCSLEISHTYRSPIDNFLFGVLISGDGSLHIVFQYDADIDPSYLRPQLLFGNKFGCTSPSFLFRVLWLPEFANCPPPHPISILKSKQINKTEIPSFAAWSNMNETKAQYAINKRHLSIMIKNISSIIFILFCIHSNVVSAIFLSWIRHKLLQDRQESEMIDKFQQSFDFDRDRPTCGSILILKFHQIATFSIFNQVWLRLG